MTAWLRNRSRAAAVAVVASVSLVASGCGVSLQSLPKPKGVGGPTYTLHAVFANVVNLPADALVRIGAFNVGYVSGLKAQNFEAYVTMKIKSSQRLPQGTQAQIRFDTPLGEDYVSLVKPPVTALSTTAAAPMIPDGATIPNRDGQTSTAPSVEDVFGALGALLNGGGLDQLQTIITQLNQAFNGNQPQIHDLLGQLSTTLTSFSKNLPDLDATLQSVATLSATLNKSKNTIVSGINALAPAVTDLDANATQLQQLVNNVAQLSHVADNVIDNSYTGLHTTLVDLAPVLDQLAGVSGQLGTALNAVDAVELSTPKIAPGDYIQASLNATVQVPPVPAGAPALHKVTVDPPDPNFSYNQSGIATLLEGGLP